GTLSGFSLPGFPPPPPNPGIEIVAAPFTSSANTDDFVLKVQADLCSFRGLVIRNAVSAGIELDGDGNVVRNCFIGTTSDGSADGGSQGIGIVARGSGNIIGGTGENDRNVISGGGTGIVVNGAAGKGNLNTIRNNLIGLAVNGATAIPNNVAM